jgi:hypothetical protein
MLSNQEQDNEIQSKSPDCLQLNQLNDECQTELILIQVFYNTLLEVQFWVDEIKFTLIPQSVSRKLAEV